jgi:hypothetical protein
MSELYRRTWNVDEGYLARDVDLWFANNAKGTRGICRDRYDGPRVRGGSDCEYGFAAAYRRWLHAVLCLHL